MTKVAEPPLNAFLPSTVLPFRNRTVSPSGGAPAPEETSAVNVTASPSPDGFGDDVSVVVVASPTMSSLSLRALLPIGDSIPQPVPNHLC